MCSKRYYYRLALYTSRLTPASPDDKLYYLLQLYEEITSAFPGDEKPSCSELSDLEYMDCVISEVLRLYPALPRMERLVSETVVIDGVTLPAGSLLSIQAYSVHHDPALWPEPFRFDPER